MNSEKLKELLHYDPETGAFTWIVDRRGKAQAGTIAGCVEPQGYIRIRIKNKLYKAHRLAWLYTYGIWPKDQIDHINGVRNDNRICNLREASNAENCQNADIRSDNTSGYIGVYWNKRTSKWVANIRVDYKLKRLGLFDTPEEAYAAYLKAKEALHEFQPVPREVITEQRNNVLV